MKNPLLLLTAAVVLTSVSQVSPAFAQEAKPATPAAPTAPAAVSSDEKAAISEYQVQMKKVENYVLNAEEPGMDLDKAKKMMKEIVELMNASKSEKLPKDLATAFVDFKDATNKLLTQFDEFPLPKDIISDQAKIGAWVAAESAKDPKFMEKFQESMGKFQSAMSTIQADGDQKKATLSAMHKKYGVEVDLDADTKRAAKAANAEEDSKPKAQETKKPNLEKPAATEATK